MIWPDFSGAREYALQRLERELDPALVYHSIAHTRDEVVPAAERLALMQGFEGEELLLLLTAALYHDLGFVELGHGHEWVSIRIAQENLPEFGYNPGQILLISGMIRATDRSCIPRTHLEALLADADLDILGCDEYLNRSHDLRMELEQEGQVMSDKRWYLHQLQFLRGHRYWTQSARVLRDAGVQENIRRLGCLLAELRPLPKHPLPIPRE
jgi:uncharacterized protein